MSIPDPIEWEDGEQDPAVQLPTAALMNLHVRDAQKWALGTTRPLVVLNGNGGYNAVWATWTAARFDGTEEVKRGGMVHSTSSNPSRITVPETGLYRGIWGQGFSGGLTTGAGKVLFAVRKNGDTNDNNLVDRYSPSLSDNGSYGMSWEFLAPLTAGDYIELMVYNGHNNSASFNFDATNKKSRLMMWYDSAN